MTNIKSNNTIQALWLGFGSLSSFMLAILSTALLSRYLPKEEYGTYRQIIYIYSALLIIFSVGLPNAYSFFLPNLTLERGKYFIKNITVLLFLAGIPFSFLLYFGSPLIALLYKNPELEKGLKIFAPVPILLLPTLGIEGIFATLRRTYYSAIFNTLSRIIMLCSITFPVIYFKGDYISALYGWSLSSFLTLVFALLFKWFAYNKIKTEKYKISYRHIYEYTGPLMLASIYSIIIKAADPFFISRYFGSQTFAEYSNGFMELPFVGMVTGAVATVLLPIFAKRNEKGDFDLFEIKRLMLNSITKSALLIYPLVIFFLFFGEEIITILYGNDYTNSIVYFRIALIGNFFRVIVFMPIFFGMGLTKLYGRMHLFTAISIWIFEYLAVIIFETPFAIAIISVISSISIIIYAFLIIQTQLRIKSQEIIPYNLIAKIILHSTFIGSFIYANNEILKINDFISNSFFFLIVNLSLYVSLILLSSSYLKIPYLSIIAPFLIKIKTKYVI